MPLSDIGKILSRKEINGLLNKFLPQITKILWEVRRMKAAMKIFCGIVTFGTLSMGNGSHYVLNVVDSNMYM